MKPEEDNKRMGKQTMTNLKNMVTNLKTEENTSNEDYNLTDKNRYLADKLYWNTLKNNAYFQDIDGLPEDSIKNSVADTVIPELSDYNLDIIDISSLLEQADEVFSLEELMVLGGPKTNIAEETVIE